MALHKHQCGDCSHIFEHEVPDTTGMSSAEGNEFYDNGHMCPACHTGPWKDRYFASVAEEAEFGRAMMREDGAPEEVIDLVLALLRGLARKPARRRLYG